MDEKRKDGTYIRETMKQLTSIMLKLLNSSYDVETYARSLLEQTKQLDYYYHFVDLNIKPKEFINGIKHPPKEGQIAYVNLGRGYPSEFHDGHWCYIVRNYGEKAFVIPCTSIKDRPRRKNEYDIDVIDEKGNKSRARMKLNDACTVDLMRISMQYGYKDVLTSKEEILERFVNSIS